LLAFATGVALTSCQDFPTLGVLGKATTAAKPKIETHFLLSSCQSKPRIWSTSIAQLRTRVRLELKLQRGNSATKRSTKRYFKYKTGKDLY